MLQTWMATHSSKKLCLWQKDPIRGSRRKDGRSPKFANVAKFFLPSRRTSGEKRAILRKAKGQASSARLRQSLRDDESSIRFRGMERSA